MTQPPFPSTITTRSPNNEVLTIKTTVRRNHQNNGHTGLCAWTRGGGGYKINMVPMPTVAWTGVGLMQEEGGARAWS